MGLSVFSLKDKILKAPLRAVRSSRILNPLGVKTLRLIFGGNPPEWVVKHFPIVGYLSISLSHRSDRQFRLWSGDDWITSRISWLGTDGFEPEINSVFDHVMEQSKTFFDVGAYVGHYSLRAVSENSSLRVYSFEPHPLVSQRLRHHVKVNNLGGQIVVVPAALSDRFTLTKLHASSSGLPSSSSLDSNWDETSRETFAVISLQLDQFVADQEVSLDAMKIDVEGCENLVIGGAIATLSKDLPAVFMELSFEYGELSPASEEADEQMRSIGYQKINLNLRSGHRKLSADSPKMVQNFLYLHPQRDFGLAHLLC